MKKFTKSMTAIAVSALVAGPAAAVDFDVYYVGDKAEVKLSAGGCKSEKEKNLAVGIYMFGDAFGIDPLGLAFDAGRNTGLWEADTDFGGVVDAEGLFVISKPGKTVFDAPKQATADVSDSTYWNMVGAVDDYLTFGDCKDIQELFGSECQVTKNDVKWSKDGEKVSWKTDMKCPYVTTKDKEKTATLSFKSNNMDLVD